MNAYNIQFCDKIRKFLKYICYLELSKKIVGTQTRVRISHGKRAIGVRAIEVRLYICFCIICLIIYIQGIEKHQCSLMTSSASGVRDVILKINGILQR